MQAVRSYICSYRLDGLDHYKDELSADLEALAEFVAVGEVVQLNVR